MAMQPWPADLHFTMAAKMLNELAHATRSTAVDAASAFRAIRVLSSGWAELHPEHRYGSAMPRLWWVLTSRRWVKAPIHYFLIEHAGGPVLFDTGIDPAIATDPRYISSAIGRLLLRRIFRIHVTAADRLDLALKRLGVDPADIRTVVLSHLHFDHVGGIAHLPNADLIVSERERAQLREPHPEREWILREHIEVPGARWRPITFEPSADPVFEGFEGVHDLACDGSMVLLPTPGHTPGSLSMLLRTEGWAPVLLVGDLTYEAALLARDKVPGTGDAAALRRSYAQVRQLQRRLPGLAIVPSHDFAAGDEIAKATHVAQPNLVQLARSVDGSKRT